jgi:hypothetical protein
MKPEQARQFQAEVKALIQKYEVSDFALTVLFEGCDASMFLGNAENALGSLVLIDSAIKNMYPMAARLNGLPAYATNGMLHAVVDNAMEKHLLAMEEQEEGKREAGQA